MKPCQHGRSACKRAFLLWLASVCVIQCSGAPFALKKQVDRAWRQDRQPTNLLGLSDMVRSYLHDAGDMHRYYAYANAMLGKPHYAYYVRSTTSWKREFLTGRQTHHNETALRDPKAPQVPYRDYLVEYPPGAFLALLPAAWVLPPGDYGDDYVRLFVALMIACLGAAFLGVLRLRPWLSAEQAAGLSPKPSEPAYPPAQILQPHGALDPRPSALWLWAALGCFGLGTCLAHRFDPVVALLLVGMSWAALALRPVWFASLFSLAVVCKGVPLLVAPLWFLLFYGQTQAWPRNRRVALFGQIVLCGVLWGLLFAIPVFCTSGLALFDAFRYHGERPLQLESTGAAVLGVLQLFYPGLLLSESGYGSSNVRLIEPDLFWLEQLFLRLQGPVVCLGLLGAMAKLLRGMRRWSQAAFAEQTLRGVCLVLVLYMVSGRVFSPQYLTWILPLGLFLSLRVNAWLTSLFVVILVLSQLLWQVIGLAGLDVWKMSLLLSRNVGLALWALALFCSPTEQTSRPASPKPPTGPPPQAQRRTKRCAQWVDRGMRAG